MYWGVGVVSCVCARCECPEIRMSPRILVAIKRKPAVSPSAYGTECRWRLEKAIFWNAGNAVCTGPEATLPPQLTALYLAPLFTPTQHPQLLGSLGLPQQARDQRPCPALLPQGSPLGVAERRNPGLPLPVAELPPLPGSTAPLILQLQGGLTPQP